jgi:hypothetical protein
MPSADESEVRSSPLRNSTHLLNILLTLSKIGIAIAGKNTQNKAAEVGE